MIRYLQAHELSLFPTLADGMFRDRTVQFRDRLKWEVTVDDAGHERDQYDTKAALYVIWEGADGRHGGSMRFLPTTGATMVAEHFLHLTDGVRIARPEIWECTRFCLAPGAEGRVAAGLMLGGLELGLRFGLSHAVGVFDAPMLRVYRALGWSPAVLGTAGGVSAGLWAFAPELRAGLCRRAEVSAELSDWWVRRAFGTALPMAG
jgi:acyl homoserine lactone synthase